MVSAGLPRASSSRSDVDESSGPSQQDSVAGTSNQHSTQPSTGSGSYLRQPSGRPKLHLKPPLADLDDQTYFVQAPAKPNPPSEVTLPQANVGQKQDMGHVNPETHRESQDRWWTFTLPADAVKKADRYWRHTHDNSEAANGKGKDPEKHNHEEDEPPSAHLSTSMSARISGAFGYSASSTPWMAPWTPFKGPATQLERGLTDPDMLHQHTNHQKMSKRTWLDKAQTFFLYSAFAPFWCRFINLSFTATVLGLAGKIYVAQTSADFEGLLGVSTVLILVIGPLSILHIFGGRYAFKLPHPALC